MQLMRDKIVLLSMTEGIADAYGSILTAIG
jgi:hypothetical protein